MRLARVRFDVVAPAVASGGHWVRAAALVTGMDEMSDLLGRLDELAKALEGADVDALVAAGVAVPTAGADLRVPLDRTRKLLAIGRNYLAHIEETREQRPEQPLLFGKFPSSLTGPYDDVVLDDRLTQRADYEVELAVIIGQPGRDLGEDEALGVVAGYAVANDLSSRDLQLSEPQWIRSKSFDGFCPLGPWITTADEVPDPQALDLGTAVNGKTRQASNTSYLLFGVAELLAFLSRGTTLEPGDVVLTGTPEGVAQGMLKPEWLLPGDVVRCHVEGLGHLENRMVAP